MPETMFLIHRHRHTHTHTHTEDHIEHLLLLIFTLLVNLLNLLFSVTFTFTVTFERHKKRNISSSSKDFSFFTVRIFKGCIIKLAFSDLTVYAIKDPHLSYFSGWGCFNL